MTDTPSTHAERLYRGLGLILTREPETSADIHGDRLYAGDAEGPYTANDRAELGALGWTEHEGSWSFRTGG